MNQFASLVFCLAHVAAFTYAAENHAETNATLETDWRITRVVMAPWTAADAASLSLKGWVGQRVSFLPDSVDGPGVLHCGHAEMEATSYPADALFQGNLPAPADDAAKSLGISHRPVEGISLSCDTGVFEFHRVDADSMLLALDNQILTLSQTPGTLMNAASPEGRTQQFLELHFGGDMGFTQISVEARRAWFSASLTTALTRYFAKPSPEDEAPVINGDPFTDSQEYPQRFAVGEATVSGDTAQVPVQFADAFSERTVLYVLRKEGDEWRLDDLRFSSGDTLLKLLE